MTILRLVKNLNPVAVVVGGLVPKGEYDNATAYVVGDSVSYDGSSYVCTTNSTGNLPTDTSYWQLLASKGDTGPAGTGDLSHEESFTAQSTVSVTHNLGKRPSVTILDSSGDECIGEVNHIDINSLTVTFSASLTGKIICN
jgi:hypothetical protein